MYLQACVSSLYMCLTDVQNESQVETMVCPLLKQLGSSEGNYIIQSH